jgi:ketosteroid isomerase-like protein
MIGNIWDRFCWIFIFNDAGKIVEIREYMNTALVQEVMTTN